MINLLLHPRLTQLQPGVHLPSGQANSGLQLEAQKSLP